MSSLGRLYVEIAANFANLQSSMDGLVRSTNTQFGRMEQSANRNFKAIEDRAQRTANSILASLGTVSAIEMGKALSRVADNYANIEAKVKLATNSSVNLAAANARVFETANKTYSSYNSLASLITKTTRSLTSMGMEAKNAFELSDRLATTVAKGLQLSGASAQETSSSILQLSQALASGKLAGDEFRSFAENAPRLAQGLSEALGVTIGELRKMSKEGKLTTDVVVRGLVEAGAKIDQEFSDLPLTIGRAFTQLENQFTKFIGEGSQVTGIATAMAHAIQMLAGNLDLLAGVGAASGMVLLARSAGQAVSALAEMVDASNAASAASMAAAVTAEKEAITKNYLAVADINAAAAAMDAARAKSVYNAQNLAIIQSERLLLNEKLKGMAVDIELIARKVAVTEASSHLSKSLMVQREWQRVLTVQTAELTAAQQAYAAVLNEMAVLGTREVANKEAQVVADNALVAAEERLAAARARGAAAAAGSAAATADVAGKAGALGTTVRGLGASLLAFVGGPVGATILGVGALAYAMYELDKSTTTADEGVRELTDRYLEQIKRMKDANKTPIELIDERRVNFEKQLLDELMAKQEEMRRLEKEMESGMMSGDAAFDAPGARYAELGQRIEELKTQLRELNDAANEAYAMQKQQERSAAAQADKYKLLAELIDTATGATDKNEKGTKKQKDTFALAEKFLNSYTQKYMDWVSASNQAMAELEASLDPLSELNKWYEESSDAIGEFAMANKNEESAVNRAKEAHKKLNAEYTKRKRELAAQKPDHQQLLDDLDFEIRALQMTNREREVEIELRRVSAGLSTDTVDWMRQEITQRYEMIDAIEAQRDRYEDLKQTVEGGSRQMAAAAKEFMRDGDMGNFFDNMADSAADMVTDILAEIWRLKVVKPFLENLFNISTNSNTGFASFLQNMAGQNGGQMSWMNMFSGNGGLFGMGGGTAGASAPGPWAGGYSFPTGGASGNGGLFGMGGGTAGASAPGPWAGGYSFPTGGASGGAGMLGGFEAMPWLAGLAGASYGLQNRGNGGLSSGLAGVSYGALGVGAYGALSGAAGAYAATGSIFGAGGAVAGGMSGAAVALPVIGWIAAIAALIDVIAGGRLFGTKFKPTSVTSTIGIDRYSGTATASREEERQRSLFRGRTWRTVSMTPTAEAVEVAEELFENVSEAMRSAAGQLGIEMPELIQGSFSQIYDAKGNLKEEFSSILGKKYKEDFEAFQKRLIAENLIAAVDASVSNMAPRMIAKILPEWSEGDGHGGGHGGGNNGPATPRGEASVIADRWREDAAQLLEGAQFLVAAQKAILEGVGLLRDGTLTQTADIVEALAQQNESLVETYSRLYEQTDVLRTAFDIIGVSMFSTDLELVEFADSLTQAAGGLQALRDKFDAYFKSYYDEAELAAIRMQRAQEASVAALEGIGLTANTTMEEARAAFESALPTLSEEAVVQWLNALNLLATVVEATEAEAERIEQAMLAYTKFTDQFKIVEYTAFQQAMRDIAIAERDAVAEANRLAEAAGMAGAAERDLANIHRWASERAAAAVRQLRVSVQDLISQLYGGRPGSMEELERRIAELEGSGQQDLSTIDQIAQANEDRYERELRAIEEINRYLESLVLGDLSTLNPQQMLTEATSQFQMALARYQSGDLTALDDLTGYAQAYLEQARSFFGSNDQYTQIFDYVTGILRNITGAGPQSQPNAPTGGQTPTGPVISPELEELYRQRDEMMAQMDAANRLQLAQLLTEQLGDLAQALNMPALELATQMGVSMQALATDLGINLEELTTGTIMQLGGIAQQLGVSLPELAASLETPMRDLVAATGISFTDLTVNTVMAMTTLARDLGMELVDLSTSVDVALGSLADAQSLMNDALEQTIAGLPPGIADDLAPYLRALEQATNEADANAALAELEGAVDDLPAQYRDLLAPFFATINPMDYRESQLSYLADITNASGATQGLIEQSNVILTEILTTLGGTIPTEPDPVTGESVMAGFVYSDDGIAYRGTSIGKSNSATMDDVVSALKELMTAVKEGDVRISQAVATAIAAGTGRRG